MFIRLRSLLAPAALAVVSAGCDNVNPNGPSVSFATPAIQTPTVGATYNFSQQPVVLTITNAPRVGSATVTYVVDVSSSSTFATTTASLTGIAEGTGGTTSATLPPLAGNTTYFWRSRAVVDGVAGAWSPQASFFIRPAVTIQAPVLVSPAQGEAIFSPRPTFTVNNAAKTGDTGVMTYEFQVSTSSTFATLAATATIPEQPVRTTWTPSSNLPEGTIFWRVRASDPASGVTGPFSSSTSFDRRPESPDQIDLSQVTVVIGPTNIGSWPIGARITSATAGPGQVCIQHPALTTWPGTIFFDDPGSLVQGNQWMFAFINGRWYGGSGRWFRPDQPCKDTSATDGFTGTFYMDGTEPLRSYVPRVGDTIGLMSTTPNRFYPSMRTVDQRTNVVLVRWGG